MRDLVKELRVIAQVISKQNVRKAHMDKVAERQKQASSFKAILSHLYIEAGASIRMSPRDLEGYNKYILDRIGKSPKMKELYGTDNFSNLPIEVKRRILGERAVTESGKISFKDVAITGTLIAMVNSILRALDEGNKMEIFENALDQVVDKLSAHYNFKDPISTYAGYVIRGVIYRLAEKRMKAEGNTVSLNEISTGEGGHGEKLDLLRSNTDIEQDFLDKEEAEGKIPDKEDEHNKAVIAFKADLDSLVREIFSDEKLNANGVNTVKVWDALSKGSSDDGDYVQSRVIDSLGISPQTYINYKDKIKGVAEAIGLIRSAERISDPERALEALERLAVMAEKLANSSQQKDRLKSKVFTTTLKHVMLHPIKGKDIPYSFELLRRLEDQYRNREVRDKLEKYLLDRSHREEEDARSRKKRLDSLRNR